jgi:hypothetical protein
MFLDLVAQGPFQFLLERIHVDALFAREAFLLGRFHQVCGSGGLFR